MITFSELPTPSVTCLRSASSGRWMSSAISVAARAETLYEQLQPLLRLFFNENALDFVRDQHTVISKSLKRLSEALAELVSLRPQLTFADPGYVAVCYTLTNGLHNILVDLKCEVDQSRSYYSRRHRFAQRRTANRLSRSTPSSVVLCSCCRAPGQNSEKVL